MKTWYEFSTSGSFVNPAESFDQSVSPYKEATKQSKVVTVAGNRCISTESLVRGKRTTGGLVGGRCMAFEDKLRQIFDKQENISRADLQRQIRSLARLAGGALRDDAWRNATAKIDKALSEAAAEARRLARILDATGYLEDKVLHKASLIVDVRLKPELRSVQDQIEKMFETKEAPCRGFVYIAWSARPEEYWYVGKANTVERLNLAAHGKLARATADATQLSLIFPTQSREAILQGVEAAMLALIEGHTGELPKLNDRRERVVENKGTDELRCLSNFLGSIADDLKSERLKPAA